MSPDEAVGLTAVDDALAVGENLVAYDRARSWLDQHRKQDLTVEHRLVLALARSGATRRAEEELAGRRLLERASTAADPVLREDLAGLHGRLAKDRAMASGGERRRRWAAEAADRYRAAMDVGVSAYPAVNAATMALLAGDHQGAHASARDALARLAAQELEDGDYWRPATEAEAWLVLGEVVQARAALDRAGEVEVGPALRATTRRQLGLLAELTGVGDSLADRLPVPGVVHYTGHRLEPLGDRDEAALRAHIDHALDAHDVGVGYGSLAAGADLLVCEALLDRGAAVRAVLPFDRDEFLDRSVRAAGSEWGDRFEAVADRVAPVHLVTDGPYRGDDCLYGHASRLAMGRAVLRARALATEPVQVAVWDGTDDRPGPAGTGADVAAWRSTGFRTHRIDPVGRRAGGGRAALESPPRRIRAALFGDVAGFSRLGDDRLPQFFAGVMGALGAVLDEAGDAVLYRNTWGDGLYVVVDEAPTAARLALDLQAAMDALDLAELGLPEGLGLRLGGHAGPMFDAQDPVRHEPTHFGRAVTTAARIEPRTPEGEVYVTGAFAALLAVEGDGSVRPEYVGHVATAKGYGDLPMYVLVAR